MITRRACLGLLSGTAFGAGRLPFQKGVNFTAEFPDGYTSTGALQLLESLPGYGVNSVALVPYGFSPKDAPTVRFSGTRTMEKDAGIEMLSAAAHKRGMKVFLKPQIWTRGGGPTDLYYATPEQRRQWFDQYTLFLEHYAKLAARIGADLFAVGVEFGKLSAFESEWRTLIARARSLYRGPLTYCANFGPEFESVKFWDAVDYLGLNNYYPLPDTLQPDAVVARVAAVQNRWGRMVVMPEAGFPSLAAPHRQPWDETPRRLSMEDQARCYEAVFQGFYRQPWFAGVYWWKVGTNGFGGPADGSHTPWRKPAMDVVKKWYLRGGR